MAEDTLATSRRDDPGPVRTTRRNTVYHLGDCGSAVAEIRARLHRLGLLADGQGDHFDSELDLAVRQFQQNVGLPTDGTAGPETYRALTRLTRSVSGGASTFLREQQAFDVLRTGVTHKVVLIDAGPDRLHRGHNANGLTEADVALDIAHRVEGRLAALGTTVLVTGPARSGHTSFDESTRAGIANEVGADVVVSLHCETHENPLAQGIAAFYFGSLSGLTNSVAGQHLAELLLDEVETRTAALNCGAHPKTWELLRLTRMPTVHLDLGYLTNEADSARLSDPKSRDLTSKAITAALIRFFAPPPRD